MQIGPFDRRRKRSRCMRCSASHLKCSGEQPCSNCGKKKLSCSYNTSASANKPVVFVKTGKHSTVDTVAFKRTIPAPVAGPGVDDTCYFYCFEVFSRRNSFTGKKKHFADDVKHLSGSHAAPFFLDSLRALGALQAAKLLTREDARRQNHVYSSVVFYAKAVASLRESLEMGQDTMSDSKRTTLLWTTLFLGMYELLNEATVMGWLQHMVHGTGRGLEAAGPSICKTEAGATFYLQAKVFEVVRTILFNAPTFLTRPEWLRASEEVWKSPAFKDAWRPLDSLLDIMALCSALRVRLSALIREQDESPTVEAPEEARHLAAEGWALREALTAWNKTYMDHETTDSHNVLPDEDSTWLAQLFYAAISIYLSGTFDWDMMHWSRWPEVSIPRLDAAVIEKHGLAILEITEMALDRTSVSPLLFLFPLRVAGARLSRFPGQCARVLGLLGQIASGYAVAHVMTVELAKTWETNKIGLTGWEVENEGE